MRQRPVNYEPVVISLPIPDRPASHAFYRRALGLGALGEIADDDVPEPLNFVINTGVRVMLVPSSSAAQRCRGHRGQLNNAWLSTTASYR
jgi:hypothetical protein